MPQLQSPFPTLFRRHITFTYASSCSRPHLRELHVDTFFLRSGYHFLSLYWKDASNNPLNDWQKSAAGHGHMQHDFVQSLSFSASTYTLLDTRIAIQIYMHDIEASARVRKLLSSDTKLSCEDTIDQTFRPASSSSRRNIAFITFRLDHKAGYNCVTLYFSNFDEPSNSLVDGPRIGERRIPEVEQESTCTSFGYHISMSAFGLVWWVESASPESTVCVQRYWFRQGDR